MNKQETFKNGVLTGRGISWCDYTCNPGGGCLHNCFWHMPDGDIAECYADTVARKFKQHYPKGFQHHYWHPERLKEPARIKAPSRIFIDSMSDLMGRWVEDWQINSVIEMMCDNPQHIFQLLTKNVPCLPKFYFPDNCHVLGSVPPDMMWNKELSRKQQERMLNKSLNVLGRKDFARVRGMSFEPLSWDVSEIVADNEPLSWAIIGAASNGRKLYQPAPDHVYQLLDVLDDQNVPVFFKGNLWNNPAAHPWREWFPDWIPSRYMGTELGKNAMPVERMVA